MRVDANDAQSEFVYVCGADDDGKLGAGTVVDADADAETGADADTDADASWPGVAPDQGAPAARECPRLGDAPC